MKDPFVAVRLMKDPFINPGRSEGWRPTERPGVSHITPEAACHPVDLAKPDHAVSRGPMHEAHHGQSTGPHREANGGAPLARCDST
jgi:hypothetical protein